MLDLSGSPFVTVLESLELFRPVSLQVVLLPGRGTFVRGFLGLADCCCCCCRFGSSGSEGVSRRFSCDEEATPSRIGSIQPPLGYF